MGRKESYIGVKRIKMRKRREYDRNVYDDEFRKDYGLFYDEKYWKTLLKITIVFTILISILLVIMIVISGEVKLLDFFICLGGGISLSFVIII